MIFPLKERVKKDKGQTTVTKKQKKEIGKLLNIINEWKTQPSKSRWGLSPMTCCRGNRMPRSKTNWSGIFI